MIIGIIGLGYVGLPLATIFSKKYNVIGFDINKEKILSYQKGIDINKEVKDDLCKYNINFTYYEKELKKADYIIIAVPTPIYKNKKPNLSYLKKASQIAGRNLKNGTTIIYESTVYPGTTEEICIPIIEKYSNKKCGKDFFVGYSPERINPGDEIHKIENIKKIVSGMDKYTLNKISKLYKSVIKGGIYNAPSIKIAEAAKIMENTQRDINIAFMNEMSTILKKININIYEVIKAAQTKWNFIPFTPGLVGGHCISVDPYYLIQKAKEENIDVPLIKTARKVNEQVPQNIINLVINQLKKLNIKNENANVAVLGLTFKEDITDIRNSKAIEIVEMLIKNHINVTVSDPLVSISKYNTKKLNEINNMDIIIFTTKHKEYRKLKKDELLKMLKSNKSIIIDIKNIFNTEEFNDLKIITL